MVMSYTTVIATLFTELHMLLKVYVFDSYQALAQTLSVPLGLAIVLYFVLMGYGILHGWVKLSMETFIKSALKISLIYCAAMHWGWFSETVVNGIQGVASDIAKTLISATPIPNIHVSFEGINSALQLVLIEITKAGAWIWNRGSLYNLGPYMTGGLIFLFGYVMILIAVVELALAQLMLAVCFAVAPLMVGFTLFKPTQGFFDRWVGMIAGYAFTLIFVSATLALCLSLIQATIIGYLSTHTFVFTDFIPLMLSGILSAGILLSAAKLGQAIGGQVTTAAGSSLAAGMVGGFIGGAMSSMNVGKLIGGGGIGALTNMRNLLGKPKQAGEWMGKKAITGAKWLQQKIQRGSEHTT